MRREQAYSLIELLTALAVVSVLSGVLLPAFAAAREKGRQGGCLSNLRQVGLACLLYAEDFDQTLPTHAAQHRKGRSPWMVAIRPYATSAELLRCPSDASDWRAVDPYYRVRRQSSYLFSFYLYDCGAEPGAPAGSCGYHTLARIPRPAETVMFAEQRTGTTQTALVGDHFHAYAFKPNPLCRREEPGSHLATTRHHGSANYAFVDGHVRWHRFEELLNWRWGHEKPARVIDRFDPDVEGANAPASSTTGTGDPPPCPQYP